MYANDTGVYGFTTLVWLFAASQNYIFGPDKSLPRVRTIYLAGQSGVLATIVARLLRGVRYNALIYQMAGWKLPDLCVNPAYLAFSWRHRLAARDFPFASGARGRCRTLNI